MKHAGFVNVLFLIVASITSVSMNNLLTKMAPELKDTPPVEHTVDENIDPIPYQLTEPYSKTPNSQEPAEATSFDEDIDFLASPTEGSAPLLVSFSATLDPGELSKYIIDLGNGRRTRIRPLYAEDRDRFLETTLSTSEQYRSSIGASATYGIPGIYTAKLIKFEYPYECYVNDCPPPPSDLPRSVAGTATITVTGSEGMLLRATPETIESGQTVKYSLTRPSNAVKATLSLACQSIRGISSSAPCGERLDVLYRNDYDVTYNNTNSYYETLSATYSVVTEDGKSISDSIYVKVMPTN